MLIGPAGSGKTAIVEGLAIRVATGAVPAPLHDIRIFDVPLLSLASSIADEPTLLGDLLVSPTRWAAGSHSGPRSSS